jgi:hypothetical protein
MYVRIFALLSSDAVMEVLISWRMGGAVVATLLPLRWGD